MGRITKPVAPWPDETHANYRRVVYKIERATVNLVNLSNDAQERNYFLHDNEMFIANIRRRLTEAHDAAVAMIYHAPTGKGNAPMWVKVTVRVITSTETMLSLLDEFEQAMVGKLFETVDTATEEMLDKCLELLEWFRKAPLDKLDSPTDENDPDDSEQDNGDTAYILNVLNLTYTKK